jgi:hypothetical protein
MFKTMVLVGEMIPVGRGGNRVPFCGGGEAARTARLL